MSQALRDVAKRVAEVEREFSSAMAGLLARFVAAEATLAGGDQEAALAALSEAADAEIKLLGDADITVNFAEALGVSNEWDAFDQEHVFGKDQAS